MIYIAIGYMARVSSQQCLQGGTSTWWLLQTILITIDDAENPILQRATNPVTSDQQLPVNISASICLQIPQDYGSVWSSDMGSDGGYSYAPQFVQVLQEYSAQTPITQNFSGCHDACSATVEAAGFALAEKAGGSWSCEDMTIVLLHAKVSRF